MERGDAQGLAPGARNQTLQEAQRAEQLAYVSHLSKFARGGVFPPNVQPSALQRCQKAGGRPRSAVLLDDWPPRGGGGGLGREEHRDNVPTLNRFHASDRVDGLGDMTCVRLLNAKGVGPTGIQGKRTPWLRAARMCLFRGGFVSNVHDMAVENVKNGGATWIFKDQSIFIKWSGGSHNTAAMSLYIELNTSHEATQQDLSALPRSNRSASIMVDEVTTCWCATLLENLRPGDHPREVRLPLKMGRIAEPETHEELRDYQRHLLCANVPPVLSLRVENVPDLDTRGVGLAWLPSQCICLPEVAVMACVYRRLAASLAQEADAARGPQDPLLAVLPKILDDDDVLPHLVRLWRHYMQRDHPDSESSLVGILRDCSMHAWLVLNCHAVAPPHIANNLQHRLERRQQIERFLWASERKGGKAPRQASGEAPGNDARFMHKPFNAAEAACAMRPCSAATPTAS